MLGISHRLETENKTGQIPQSCLLPAVAVKEAHLGNNARSISTWKTAKWFWTSMTFYFYRGQDENFVWHATCFHDRPQTYRNIRDTPPAVWLSEPSKKKWNSPPGPFGLLHAWEPEGVGCHFHSSASFLSVQTNTCAHAQITSDSLPFWRRQIP